MGRWTLLLLICLAVRDDAPVVRPATVALGEQASGALGDADKDELERLRQTEPLAFLEMCLERYKMEVQGYTANFRKREKVGARMLDPEAIEVAFREQPFSVFMNWTSQIKLIQAQKVLYVEGENQGKLLARPKLPFILPKDIHGAEARAGSRYTIDQFGMYQGMERSVASMKAAWERGQLHLKYLGETKEPRLGDIACYVFVRSPYVPLEEQGLNELTIFVDKENWLQVGSILRDDKGELIAEYFFRDVQINPEFPDGQFSRAALEK